MAVNLHEGEIVSPAKIAERFNMICPCGGVVMQHDNVRKDGSGETVGKCRACGRRQVLLSWKAIDVIDEAETVVAVQPNLPL